MGLGRVGDSPHCFHSLVTKMLSFTEGWSQGDADSQDSSQFACREVSECQVSFWKLIQP